jgi:hypothetical protein
VDDATETTGEAEFVGLLAGARRLGELRGVEQLLFELVGGWVTEVPGAATKAWLATASLHHAWHAELLAGVLPTLAAVEGVSPEGLTVVPPGSSPLGRLVAPPATGGAEAAADHYARTTLPGLVEAHGSLRAALSPVGDRPARRVLDIILADEQADLAGAPGA